MTASAVLLNRAAHDLDCEIAAIRQGLRPETTSVEALARLAAEHRAAAQMLRPGFKGR